MAYYGVIYPEFWTGTTGRGLRTRGKDAQLLALYLMTSPHANMLGLYHLPPVYVRQESGLSARAWAAATAALEAETFAFYDAASEFVWVREMARFRMGLGPDRPTLDSQDKKAIGAQRIYAALPANAFLGTFYDRYHKALHLRKRREGPQPVVLPSPFEAPSKPDNRSTEVQKYRSTEIRKQEERTKDKNHAKSA